MTFNSFYPILSVKSGKIVGSEGESYPPRLGGTTGVEYQDNSCIETLPPEKEALVQHIDLQE